MVESELLINLGGSFTSLFLYVWDISLLIIFGQQDMEKKLISSSALWVIQVVLHKPEGR